MTDAVFVDEGIGCDWIRRLDGGLEKHLPGDHDQDKHGRRRHHVEFPNDRFKRQHEFIADFIEDAVDVLGHERTQISDVRFFGSEKKFVDVVFEQYRTDEEGQLSPDDERRLRSSIREGIAALSVSETGLVYVSPTVYKNLLDLAERVQGSSGVVTLNEDEAYALTSIIHELAHKINVDKPPSPFSQGAEEGLAELVAQFSLKDVLGDRFDVPPLMLRQWAYGEVLYPLLTTIALKVSRANEASYEPGRSPDFDKRVRAEVWRLKEVPQDDRVKELVKAFYEDGEEVDDPAFSLDEVSGRFATGLSALASGGVKATLAGWYMDDLLNFLMERRRR